MARFLPGCIPYNKGVTSCVCIVCTVPTRRSGRRCRNCYDNLRAEKRQTRSERIARMRTYHAKIKDEVFKVYGGYVCVCCGETEKVFLVIDHVNGGGNAQRRALSKNGTRGGAGQYYWLRRQGFPSGYQVLCHNCNFAKTRGECPHASSIQSATGSNGK